MVSLKGIAKGAGRVLNFIRSTNTPAPSPFVIANRLSPRREGESVRSAIIRQSALGTAGTAAAAGVAAFPAAAGRGALAAGRFILPKTRTGALFAAGTALAASTSPTLRKALLDFPQNFVTGSRNLGRTIETLPANVKEKASGFGAAGLLVAGGIGTLLGAGGVMIAKKIEDFKSGKEEVMDFVPLPAGQQPGIMPSSTVGEETSGAMPMSPETVETDEAPRAVRRKRRNSSSKPRGQTISQSVRVNVIAGNKTNKFIKKATYL